MVTIISFYTSIDRANQTTLNDIIFIHGTCCGMNWQMKCLISILPGRFLGS
jgi:hypothetical protein